MINRMKKGINLAGWLSQCTHEKHHYDTFISENDIQRIAGYGFDHVRLPIDYECIEDENGRDIYENYVYLDKCLEWCKQNDLKVIFDLHKAYGYCFDNCFGNNNLFFESESLQKRFIELWIRLAKRYGKYHDILAFELLNEVDEAKCKDNWNRIIKTTIEKIRDYAAFTKILVGGVNWNGIFSIKDLDYPYDENVIYTFHFYEPFLFTHQNANWVEGLENIGEVEYPISLKDIRALSSSLRDEQKIFLDNAEEDNMFDKILAAAVKVAQERNVELYCGEFGVIDRAPVESTGRWFEDIHKVFEKYDIGHALWSYKEMNFGIIGDHYKAVFEQIITC